MSLPSFGRSAVLLLLSSATLPCLAGPVRAAFTLDDVAFWTGASDGPGVHRAALVIDWNDGLQPASFAWGYRWPANEARTGADLLRAVVDADPRLTVDGIESGFVQAFRLEFAGFGEDSPVRFRPGFNPDTGEFWNYWVNNPVEAGNFTATSHLLPPNGDPFAAEMPGTWFTSNTGIFDRPLADGSWDGFIYAEFAGLAPREPEAIGVPVPEPSAVALVAAGAGFCLAGRRRTAGNARMSP